MLSRCRRRMGCGDKAPVAQWIEYWPPKPGVVGSNPAGRATVDVRFDRSNRRVLVTITPTNITLHSASRVLEIEYDDGRTFRLPYEFLRVFSPSAEVRGHGPGQEVLQVGKKDVTIAELQSVGHYAVRPVFSDGHDSGIYSWDYLHELGVEQERLWSEYLARLDAAGGSREPNAPENAPLAARSSGACGHHH